MIDAENEVFSTVAAPVRAAFPGIHMTSEVVAIPHTFPCASLVEMDSSIAYLSAIRSAWRSS